MQSQETFFETENFIIEFRPKPFVSRTDGGHVRISVKDKNITDRTKLHPKQAIELMRLSMVVGEALEKGMNAQGVPVVKINYQDMGNWAHKEGKPAYLHYHIFGRSKDSIKQPYPEAVYLPDRSTGFYDNFEPLNSDDVRAIRSEIERLFMEERYSDKAWGLS